MINQRFDKPLVILIIQFAIFTSTCLLTCSKDEKPEITGCNTIKYKGKAYSNVGCAPGIRSFTIDYGGGVCFNVQCSGGCISSVSLCSGNRSLSKTIVGPDEEQECLMLLAFIVLNDFCFDDVAKFFIKKQLS